MVANRPTCADICWQKLLVDWVKANSDGTVCGSDSLAIAGGVIRDDQGGWIYGCARHIGRCYVLMAELWATHDILLAAWNLGFRRIQFETDNLEVAQILQGRSDALIGCSLVDTIRLLLTRSWSVNICHISRMQNMVVDRVVALCRDSLSSSMVFDSVPAALVRKEVVSF
ncbi:hypothetical protein V6N12_060861 [Hibiscus sabdariffa]|uniref:RNase H type-1 domain-containing protein n=1 Tax=Hibiscus sabdariffa TaxID=183260 RepID=A0ABR2D5P9_9ROSI